MVAEAKVEFAKKYRKVISLSREEKEEVLSAKKRKRGWRSAALFKILLV